MRDVQRGRLFRVTAKGADKTYSVKAELNEDNAIAWLTSPNQSRRYLAWTMIEETKSNKVLGQLINTFKTDGNPRFRARAMWLLGEVLAPDQVLEKIVGIGLADINPNIRIAALRFCRRYREKIDFEEAQKKFNLQDPNPQVRREFAVGLREMQPSNLAKQWIELAKQHDGKDRWYLEALGIAAEGHWDACLELLIAAKAKNQISEAAWRDLVWRSLGAKTPQLLTAIIQNDDVSESEALRYFRSFDFIQSLAPEPVQRAAEASLAELGFSELASAEKSKVVFRESTQRISLGTLSAKHKARVDQIMTTCDDSEFVELAESFGNDKRDKKLLELALEYSNERLGADAMATLIRRKQLGLAHYALQNSDEDQFNKYVNTLVRCGVKEGGHVLAGYFDGKENPMDRRIAAVRALGKTSSGAGDLLWRVENKRNDPDLEPVIAATLHGAPWEWARERAAKHFPLPPSKDAKPMPSIADLMKRSGNIENGAVVFAGTGTCAKCHIVNGKGIEIGPDLSEIGDKLSREAMFESILFPSAGISHNYENWIVAKDDGEIISGLLLTKTNSTTTIKDINGVVHQISSDEIEAQKRLKLSLMPADLVKEFGEQDLVDLVDYLMTLKKQK